MLTLIDESKGESQVELKPAITDDEEDGKVTEKGMIEERTCDW